MATQKQVTIVARYAHKTNGKLNGTVSYLVRSSDGKSEYCTTLVEGKASGCSCPSRKGCYHRKQLEAIEAARDESNEQKESREWSQYRSQLAKKLAVQFVSTQCVEQIAEKQNVEKPPIELRGYREKAIPTDISTKGNLNGQRGFSLLKVG